MSDYVVVTGGAGYIGSHCCKLLAEKGYTPVTVDNLTTGWEDFVKFGPLERADIRDRDRLKDIFARYAPETVMHFAARALVSESVTMPLEYFDVNVGGTVSLLDACREHGVKNFVFSSSAAVYGAPDVTPISIGAPKRPVNPYGASKLMAEEIISHSCGELEMAATCFRYFNAAGAHPDGGIGERHDPETHLIPNILLSAARGEPAILYGNDYPTADGTCVRDYVHVCDLADAHVSAIERPAEPGQVRFFNLGTGTGCSLLEVVRSVERVIGKKIDLRFASARPGDPPQLVAGDIQMVERSLGWRARHSEIDSIVADARGWWRRLELARNC